MTLFKNVLITCLMTFFFTSCSKPESIEKVVKDYVSREVEMISILNSVKDKASALAAKPKLEQLGEKYKSLGKSIKALKITELEFWQYVKMDERLENRQEVYSIFFETAKTDKEIGTALEEVYQRIAIDKSSFVPERR